MTIIKENSGTSFEVTQTVQTKSRAKTCTLDTKKDQIVLIATEPLPASAQPAAALATPATPTAPPAGEPGQGGGRKGDGGGPAMLDILVVGR